MLSILSCKLETPGTNLRATAHAADPKLCHSKVRTFLLSCCHWKSSVPVIGIFCAWKILRPNKPIAKNSENLYDNLMTHPFCVCHGISQLLETTQLRHGASSGVMKDARTVLRESVALVSVRVSAPCESLGREDVVHSGQSCELHKI